MQKHTPSIFLTDFHMQKYTRGIILWVGIFLTITPGCLHQKQSHPSVALGLVAALLFLTPSPFTDLGMCCGGELDTGWCVSAAGMEGWVARLVFVPINCCLGCVVGDGCGVLLG